MSNVTTSEQAIRRSGPDRADAAALGIQSPVIIRPSRGWLRLGINELWQYRELLYCLTWRDIKIRYKQTVLGFLWAFLQPFTKMIVFTFVFGRMAKLDSEGFPYPIFVFAGLLPWQFFSEALNRSSQSVVSSASVITKVYFPRLFVPLSAVCGCLIDFCISFLILMGLMLYYGVPPLWSLLAVAPLALMTVLTALGIGTLISALNVAYRDFRYVIPFIINIWMFLTPVVYSVRAIPASWRWLLVINPMTGIVDGFRSAIMGKPFDLQSLSISITVCAVMLVGGLMYFRRIERQFADII